MVDSGSASYWPLLILEQGTEHAVLALALDSTIVWANETAHRILGYEPDTLRGMQLSALFTPEENALGLASLEIEVARAGSVSEDDRWQQKQDGTRFWASGALVPLHDGAGALVGFGKIFRNRSDLRLQLDRLQNQLAVSAEHATRRDNYVATIAHDLRNPLTPLLMSCSLLRAASDDPRVLDAASMIERQVDEMTRVIDRVLDAAASDSREPAPARVAVSLTQLLADVERQMRSLATARSHSLALLVPQRALFVIGDRERLAQAFVNLVANAIKFTPHGGRIWIKLTKEGTEIVCRVEDTGIGLAADQMERIFEMFARADPASEVAGSGIGLAIVKTVVELHDGTVQVESDGPGTGSKFTVRLPMVASPR